MPKWTLMPNRTLAPETQGDRAIGGRASPSGPPPLNANIRRHLGSNLRNLYADVLNEPPDARIEALLAELGKPKN